MNGKATTDRKRRVVYLKDRPDTRSANTTSCSGIVCPGHCACASK